MLVLLAGCEERIDNEYGRRAGPSVNGTAVLARMIEQAGHKVSVRRRLTSRLNDQADVMVWMPDDDGVLQDEPRRWLEDWLRAKPARVLVYVGRDFDAAPLYWKTIQPLAPADQASEVQQRLDDAEADFTAQRAMFPQQDEDCGWFVLKAALVPRKVSTLAGPWSEGVDASQVGIELNGRLEMPIWAAQIRELEKKTGSEKQDGDASSGHLPIENGYEVLLESNGDVLVSRQRFNAWDGSQLIVVANGSFLLNLPLVNHQHRVLAGKLIDEFPPESRVVLIESDVSGLSVGPPVAALDKETEWGWKVYFAVFHLAVLGIVFCLSRWPIFGRALEADASSQGDFGKHITALGKLLMLTKDVKFARTRVLNYRQKVHPNRKSESLAPPTIPTAGDETTP